MSYYDVSLIFQNIKKRVTVIVWIEKHGTKNSEASKTPPFLPLKEKDTFPRNF